MMLDYEWGAAAAMPPPPFSDEFGGETGQERATMFDHYAGHGVDAAAADHGIGSCITDFIPQLQPLSAAAVLFSPSSSTCSFNQRYGMDLPGMGLNLGVRTYFPSSSSFLAPEKAAGTVRVSRRRARTAKCQAEGCGADLAHAKHYHRRHKVCEFHSKASVVVAAGLPQRFCQQCSRFHVLGEFDQGKRSCRKRLAEHNRRRRKSQDLTTSCATNNRNESVDMAASTMNTQKPEMVLFTDPSSGSNGSTTAPSLPSPATPPQYHSQTKMALHLGHVAEGVFGAVQMDLSESTAPPGISFFSQLSGRSPWE